MNFATVINRGVRLYVAVEGQGPLILFVHGWPELWYSWRHQLEYFSQRGFTAAAFDQRGYGGSDKPAEVSAYGLKTLASDVAAVIDAIGGGRAILVGHDWGAPVAWTTTLLHPERIVGVAGLSIPYFPPTDTSFVTFAREAYADRFFYQLYFQNEGGPERELEADVRDALGKIYFAWSGDADPDIWLARRPPEAKLLDGLPFPPRDLPWLTAADLDVYAAAFGAGGFRGPLNRYRAQELDVSELAPVHGGLIERPACFIAGDRDPVRSFVPGGDLFASPELGCSDFRGSTIIEGAGHWVQQEAPDAVNTALEAFIGRLTFRG